METLKLVSEYAIANKEEFEQKVRDLAMQKQFASLKEQKALLAKKEKRYNELKGLVKKLYESYATEKISEKNFEMLSADYEAEQESLETEIRELQIQIEEYNVTTDNAEQFLNIAKKYTEFSVLTAPMLNEFIEKIIVHAPVWNEGERTQEVEFYFNFIGKFDIPAPQLTPEELAEIELKEKKRRMNRIYHQRSRERKKQGCLPNNRQKSKKNKNRLMNNQHNINKLRRFAILSRPSFLMQKFDFGGKIYDELNKQKRNHSNWYRPWLRKYQDSTLLFQNRRYCL